MNASTRHDRNYCSINGWGAPGPDGIRPQGPFISIAGGPAVPYTSPSQLPDFSQVNPAEWASLLKVCDGAIVTLTDLVFPGGAQEGAIDVNWDARLVLWNCTLGRGLDRTASVKGGSTLILINCTLGPNSLVKVDEWSDQSYAGSRYERRQRSEAAYRAESGPFIDLPQDLGVVIARYYASVVVGGQRAIFSSLTHTAYWWMKRVIRLALKIPKGVKGPSWF